MPGLLSELRRKLHDRLCSELLARRQRVKGRKEPVLNICDKCSKPSIEIAERMLRHLDRSISTNDFKPQTLGAKFAEFTGDFVIDALTGMRHLRPGHWKMATKLSPLGGIAGFAQFEHLGMLQRLVRLKPELRAILGGDYLVTPDIVVFRDPIDDRELDAGTGLISPDDRVATYSPLRKAAAEKQRPILLASISMKWTIRSDRAQNTRTEALNLMRNRKGAVPKFVVVTFEPLPMRIASIAEGTGDIDCTYHPALHELIARRPSAVFY